MKRFRIVGLCLIAVFAFTAVAAASASAEPVRPEYMTCAKVKKNATTKKYEGKYEKGCLVANAKGEGKYETEPVKTPLAFRGKSKASTFYYWGKKAGEGILWEVKCKKDADESVITSSTESTLNITFEKCEIVNVATKVKTKCATNLTAKLEGRTEEGLPGEEPVVLLNPEFTEPYECGSIKVTKGSGFELGKLENTSKGPVANLAVNKLTGEQNIQEFYWFEEEVEEGSFSYVNVNGGTNLGVGVETAEALGPKTVVVVG